MSEEKKNQLKAKFRKMDKNGDGQLDFNEFLELMRGLDAKTAHQLFDKVSGEDQMINFDEFVDYIYSTESRANNRTSAGRHARLAAASAVGTDSEDEAMWNKCRTVFGMYSGLDKKFESKDWKKLNLECKLFDRKYTKNDLDLVFTKYKPKGGNSLDFDAFQNCLRAVAQKKGVPTSVVQAAVAEREELGVESSATKADFVRFHDDKTTYTGAHTHNENHGAAGGAEHQPGSRRDRIASQEALTHDQEDELPWDDTKAAFINFCKGDEYLDSREFNQLCTDAGLFKSGKFVAADADVIFNKVKNRGERKIDWEQFKDALVGVARKRGCAVSQVQTMIVECQGPKQHGVTKADAVRFHDDKDTYTGMHVGK